MNVLEFQEKPPDDMLRTMSMDTSCCFGGCPETHSLLG